MRVVCVKRGEEGRKRKGEKRKEEGSDVQGREKTRKVKKKRKRKREECPAVAIFSSASKNFFERYNGGGEPSQ
jgi:hypothetical protein